jgi:hypothetical protein
VAVPQQVAECLRIDKLMLVSMTRITLSLFLIAAAGLRGQTTPPTPPAAGEPVQTQAPAQAPARVETARPEPKPKRVLIGIRAREFPLVSLGLMENRTTLSTTTTTIPRDWSFTTASHSSHFGIGPAVEFIPGPRWAISVEALWDKLQYTKVTSIAWGTDDPATTNDERTHMFRDENTRAVLWDFPVMVHYRGLRPTGPLSRLYLAAGGVVRTATKISTTTKTTFPDTTSTTSSAVAAPSRRNLLGATAGIGFRIVDDFRINWTPEIRYTRWAGSTFATDSTLSPRNQLEVSLGFTF